MPAIFHVKIEDESFDGAVNHIVEASDDDTVWHCEEAGDNFDGAIFHVKWAEDGHEEPVWRVSGISRGTVTTVGPAVSPLLLPDAIADSLAYVKAYGGTEQRDIPDNYLQRQYIYMLDGSYLLTDIVPTYDGRYELDFQTTTVNLSDDAFYLGGEIRCGLLHLSSGLFRVIGFGEYKNSAVNVSNNTRYKFVWDNQKATLTTGNTVILDETYTATSSTTVPLGINCYNSTVTPDSNNEGIYLYSFKAWNAQGELVADYVPAVQKGTVPVVGFYDTVSKTFKTATAGTFAAGPEAAPTPDAPMDIISNNGVLKARHQSGLPLGYTALQYIESTATQYIDTGYIPNSNTKLVLDVLVPTLTTGACTFAGAMNDAWRPGFGVYGGNTTYKMASVYDSSDVTGNPEYASNTRYTIELNGRVYTVSNDGAVVYTYTHPASSSFVAPATLNLFMIDINPDRYGKFRLYSAKIYNNNTLIRDFIPAQQGTTVGLYDTVSGQFFTNAGTGVFGKGTPVSDPVEIYTDGTVETIRDSAGHTATAEMLLKVGDYQDVQSIIDGAITRNVGIKVLDGTESWQNLSGYMNISKTDLGTNSDVLPTNTYNIICSHFEAKTGAFTDGIGVGGSYVNFKYDSLFTTLTQWKRFLADQYAAGTPVIVIYPLAEPTTESVAGQTLQVTDGDNTVEITQASIDGLELEAKYMKGVVASVQEVEPQGLDNNVSVSLS